MTMRVYVRHQGELVCLILTAASALRFCKGILNVLVCERGAGSFCAPPRAGMASQLLCFMCALGDQQRVVSLALLLPVVHWGAALQMGTIELTGNVNKCFSFCHSFTKTLLNWTKTVYSWGLNQI